MKEYPILFSGSMVRAILEGRKTQTRRLDVDRWTKRKVGERLWVKETWAYFGGDEYLYQQDQASVAYRATWDLDRCAWTGEGMGSPTYIPGGKWRPSIFMFRWASRILVELTEDPRKEQLLDISEADAKAEGARPADLVSGRECILNPEVGSYRLHYQSIWDSINSKTKPWSSNPTVAAIAFRRVI
jgi:hypothetical protein